MKEKRLAECLKGKSKNVDFIKFIASIGVIYSHAYAVCGYSEYEIVEVFSGGKCH